MAGSAFQNNAFQLSAFQCFNSRVSASINLSGVNASCIAGIIRAFVNPSLTDMQEERQYIVTSNERSYIIPDEDRNQ